MAATPATPVTAVAVAVVLVLAMVIAVAVVVSHSRVINKTTHLAGSMRLDTSVVAE